MQYFEVQNGLYVKIAEAAAQAGFSTYRADLSGVGNSDGLIEETTFEKQVEDIYKIVEFAKKDSASEKVNTISHCGGGDWR